MNSFFDAIIKAGKKLDIAMNKPKENNDYPYLLGSKTGIVDDKITDEWKNTERFIVVNGKTYVTSGNNVIGQSEFKNGELTVSKDLSAANSNLFVAVNIEDPNDKIVVETDVLSNEFANRINLSDSEGERPNKEGGTTYDPSRSNWVTPDTLFVNNPRKKDNFTKGKFEDGYGNQYNTIKIYDTKYEDIKIKKTFTKELYDKLPASEKDALREEGITRENFGE
tara:strand:+ start:150 stop:818 length:669 start_codon:yes stop_codon:yes gene_type:complete